MRQRGALREWIGDRWVSWTRGPLRRGFGDVSSPFGQPRLSGRSLLRGQLERFRSLFCLAFQLKTLAAVDGNGSYLLDAIHGAFNSTSAYRHVTFGYRNRDGAMFKSEQTYDVR